MPQSHRGCDAVRQPEAVPPEAWEVAAVARWWAAGGPHLAVTGGPGSGKSVFLRSLVSRARGGRAAMPVHASHACAAAVPGSADPRRVLASIGAQLVRTVPDYAAPAPWAPAGSAGDPAQQARCTALRAPTAAAAFEYVLRRPLAGRRPGIVVVVDGVDESLTGRMPGDLLDVLDAHTGDPVPGLRLVTGARTPLPGGAQPPLGFAGGERPRRLPGAVLDLAQRPAPAFEAVRAWLGHRYALRRADQDRIVERASGHRGYADLAARLVSAGVALPDRAGDLDALYAHELARLAGVHRILPSMLAVLARVRGEGFAPARLASLLGVPLADVTAAAAAARHLLRGRTGLRLYHRCLAEHLAMHGTDPAAVDWRIAQYLCMQVDGRRPPDPYALRHLPVHLADAAWGLVRQDSAPRRMIGVDRGGAARRLLDELIADPTFLIRAVSTVGAEAVHTALSYVEVRSDAVAPDTACVTRMLRGQLPVLGEARAVDPAWTAQQLCYEAAGAGAYLLMTGLAAQVVGIQTQWATGIPGSGERPAGQRITHVAITAGGGYGVSTDARGVVRSWRLDAGPVPYMAAGAGTIVDGPGSLEWAPRRATWRFHNTSAWRGRSRYWVKPHAGYARRAVAAAADRVGSAAFALAPGAGVFLVGDARGLTVYHLGGARHGQVAGRLRVHHGVSAVAVNPVDHDLALLGTPSGQLVYVRLALGR